MKQRKKKVFFASLSILIAFLGGITTEGHNIIPYSKLRAVINRVTPKPPRRVSYFASPAKSEPSTYYLDQQSFFQEDSQTYDVVMVGASIIEAAEWEDLFPSLNIANRGHLR